MGLLFWKMGCHKLAHASNQARISPSADHCAMVLKECAVTYGPAPSVEDIHAHLPPDLPSCAFLLSIHEVKMQGDIRPMRHEGGACRVLGFCHEHAGNLVVKCENDMIALKNKFEKGTLRRATVAVVVMLVPHHVVYYTGYPVLAYGSCNKFTPTHMQDLLCGLVETWTNSERLMARGFPWASKWSYFW